MTASTLLQGHFLDPVNVCSCSGVFMDLNPTSYYWGGNQSRCQGAGVSFLFFPPGKTLFSCVASCKYLSVKFTPSCWDHLYSSILVCRAEYLALSILMTRCRT